MARDGVGFAGSQDLLSDIFHISRGEEINKQIQGFGVVDHPLFFRHEVNLTVFRVKLLEVIFGHNRPDSLAQLLFLLFQGSHFRLDMNQFAHRIQEFLVNQVANFIQLSIVFSYQSSHGCSPFLGLLAI